MNLDKKLVTLVFMLFSLVAMAKEFSIDFEKNHPYSWKSISTWKLDKNSKTLSMVGGKKSFFGFGDTFNLYFTKGIDFKDGEISVKFRANSGKIDQGGGLMWRVQDKDNYYIARFNPLEDNFTFYKVIDGDRIELKNIDVGLSKGWHEMKIIQKGSHFEGYLDGKQLLKDDDNSIRKGGGIGVWTKTDAKTSFKSLTVKN